VVLSAKLGESIRRRAVGALLVGALLVSCAGLASAQISEFDEPPTVPTHRSTILRPAAAPAPAAPAVSVYPATETAAPGPARRAAPVAPQAGVSAPAGAPRGSGFSYTVRPGDSLGSIASQFGIEVEDLARANHLGSDSMLIAGRTLRIPNPFEAQVRTLSAQLEALRASAASADEKVAAATMKERSAAEKLESLTADNEELQREVAALPRWRGTAVTLGIVALLMFGVMMVTLFEWWLLRRRFATLVEITDSLTSLDQKYKSIVAKAELRFQQLYGRRRQPGAEATERGKSAEEIEIERLNHELREALEHQLHRLGVARARPRRSGRWREILGDVEPSVEPRSVRR
jgi:LysM repeat protein